MAYDDSYDDEDWYDDDDEPGEEAAADCPECGEPFYAVSDKCPACGYWLSDADRRAMWSGEDKPAWIRVTASIVLIAIVVGLLVAGVAFF